VRKRARTRWAKRGRQEKMHQRGQAKTQVIKEEIAASGKEECKRRCHPVVAQKQIPWPVGARAQFVEAQTAQVDRMARHLHGEGDNPNFRDGRARAGFGAAVEERANTLVVLQAQSPELAEKLRRAIQGGD